MAKDKNPTVEVEETEAPKGIRPKDLATELEVDAKTLRSFLRREFPRSAQEKNTSWQLTEAQVEAARKHFADEDDTSDEDEA